MLNQPRYPYPQLQSRFLPFMDKMIEPLSTSQPIQKKVLLLMCIVLPMETDGSIVYLALLVILSIDPT